MFYYVLRKTQEFVSDSWEISLISAMKYIGGGMAAPSKLAVGPIWLGCRLRLE